MYAPYNGVTTRGSIFPRSELLEHKSPGTKGWDLKHVSAKLSVTVAVNRLAQLATGNDSTVVIGQILSYSTRQPVRLYYHSSGALYWETSPPLDTGCVKVYEVYLYSSENKKSSIPLNVPFSYTIQTNTSHRFMQAFYQGIEYSSLSRLESCWTGHHAKVYFKAGCYCHVNNNSSSEYFGKGGCQVTIYSLNIPIKKQIHENLHS